MYNSVKNISKLYMWKKHIRLRGLFVSFSVSLSLIVGWWSFSLSLSLADSGSSSSDSACYLAQHFEERAQTSEWEQHMDNVNHSYLFVLP